MFTGLPCYWMNETSGKLRLAVHGWLDYVDNPTLFPLKDRDIVLLKAYFKQWINAPAYLEAEGFEAEKAQLRTTVEEIKTADDIKQWLNKAIEIGIDPL